MQTKNLIFVFGCQRSGTTATIDGLKRIAGCRVFDEENETTNRCHERFDAGMALRLKPWSQVRQIIDECGENTVVLKPLVESQNARQLLDFFSGSVGLWLFRHYRDVVSSMLAKWGAPVGRTPMLSIIQGRKGDWRSEHVSPQTRELVQALKQQHDLSAEDAAALFWYVRNQHFFRQELEQHQRVRLISYAQLVSNENLLADVLAELGIPLPFPPGVFHSHSLAKGSTLQLNPQVQQLCQDLDARLQDHCRLPANRRPVEG